MRRLQNRIHFPLLSSKEIEKYCTNIDRIFYADCTINCLRQSGLINFPFRLIRALFCRRFRLQ